MKQEKFPLISIAVPVYNSETFLGKCLTSLINQTYTNLEIVILNNDSTDKSLTIIEEFSRRDTRIKYFTIPHVPTETWSRNNAFLRTTAEWVVPIDSDDSIEPTYIEKLWHRHLETMAEWVGATMTLISVDGVECGRIPGSNFDYSQVLKGYDAVILTLGKWTINANGALIHRHLVPCLETGESKPLFNVEYDTRVILYNAKKVAFVDAKYYFGYNPNSVGRKPSFTKDTYVLHSYVGLLPFIISHYDRNSMEVKTMTKICRFIVLNANNEYAKLSKVLTMTEKKAYKMMIESLFINIPLFIIEGPILQRILRKMRMWINVIKLRYS